MSLQKQNRIQSVIGIIILVFFILLIFLFIKSLINADPKISTPVIAGMFTIFGGIATVMITQKQTKMREIEEAHREKKIEIYKEFINIATDLLGAKNKNLEIQALSEKDLIVFMLKYKREILLWGSPEVIKAQLEFEKLAEEGSALLVIAMNKLYKAMREDIGLSNSGLNNNELIKLFLTDPDELDLLLTSTKK